MSLFGTEPSHYVLRAIHREEKSELSQDESGSSFFPFFFFFNSIFFVEMMTKFNQKLYAWIKAKKNEPFSSIGQRRVRVVEKEKEKEVTEKCSSTPVPKEGWAASPIVSIKEITPHAKKHKTGDKGKEKVGASIQADAGATLARVNEVVMLEEMKEISSVPSHEMVSRHVHKLV